MRRWLPVLLALLPLGLSSCAFGQDAETTTATVAPTTTTLSSAAGTPTGTPPGTTPTEVSRQRCTEAFAAGAKHLAGGWGLVVSSRAEAEEATYVVEFADAARDLFDSVEDSDCEAETVAAAATLNFEASSLALPFRAGGSPAKPPGDQYGKVIAAGAALLEHLAVSDSRFVALECKDRMNESEECTPVP